MMKEQTEEGRVEPVSVDEMFLRSADIQKFYCTRKRKIFFKINKNECHAKVCNTKYSIYTYIHIQYYKNIRINKQ